MLKMHGVIRCVVIGCIKLRDRRPNGHIKSRYCTMHRSRLHRWGIVGKATPTRGLPGTGCVRQNGYKYYTKKGRQAPEHRLVWEAAYGPIPEGCCVHHLNEDKLDNRLENLVCMSRSEHMRLHRKEYLCR